MSNPAPINAKAWLQELKGNRKTQVALLAFLGGLTYLFWPEAPRPQRKGSAGRLLSSGDGDRQLQALSRLPDLGRLDKAAELPREKDMARDLFLFDGPPPPPPPPPPPQPPPPPPTEAEVAARELKTRKDAELAGKPAGLRYLGFLGSEQSGRIAAFIKAEEPMTLRVGDLANPKWRLVAASDQRAEFQNLTYPDLKYRIEAVDSGGAPGQAVRNEF